MFSSKFYCKINSLLFQMEIFLWLFILEENWQFRVDFPAIEKLLIFLWIWVLLSKGDVNLLVEDSGENERWEISPECLSFYYEASIERGEKNCAHLSWFSLRDYGDIAYLFFGLSYRLDTDCLGVTKLNWCEFL